MRLPEALLHSRAHSQGAGNHGNHGLKNSRDLDMPVYPPSNPSSRSYPYPLPLPTLAKCLTFRVNLLWWFLLLIDSSFPEAHFQFLDLQLVYYDPD